MVYEFGPQGVLGQLKGKRAVVFTTSNTPRDDELRLFGDPLENLWKTCIFGFCGVDDFYRRNFESIIMSTPDAAGRLAGRGAADRSPAVRHPRMKRSRVGRARASPTSREAFIGGARCGLDPPYFHYFFSTTQILRNRTGLPWFCK